MPDNKNVQNFGVSMKRSVFPLGNQPMHREFETLLHYPGQLLRSIETHKYSWNPWTPNTIYSMRFKVNALEIIKRRNKKDMPCSEEWEHDDDQILVNHTNYIGCRAPYHNPSNRIAKCSTKYKIAEARFNISSDGYGLPPPCKTIGKLLYTYEEADLNGSEYSTDPSQFWVGIWLADTHFKEIKQIR